MFVRVKTFEEEREMDFVEAYAEEIDVKDIADKIKSKDNGPIPKYLKRIKKLSEEKALMLKSITEKQNENQIAVKIPAFEPITKDQFELAKNIWPCHFFNTFIDKFDEEAETKKIYTLCSIMDQQREEKAKNRLVDGNKGNNLPIENNEKIDCNHNDLLCIGKNSDKDYLEIDSKETFCSRICLIFDNDELISTEFDSEKILGHAILKAVKGVSVSQRGYLCTGYTAVLYREPCLSCSMALVHGRIKKILVIEQGDEAPYSTYKINHNKDLNHRCQVYFYKKDLPN